MPPAKKYKTASKEDWNVFLYLAESEKMRFSEKENEKLKKS